ncbi:MAG: hypothetical protein GWM98_05870, partial [Nitrospinaceae bacterium]|nr:hypothetical protein [Nitrospinaceae bacterium]NIR54085.1 hypothetical protein [Nitrospinaceae bacterium]NIS84503.1 hypothetical protein [Nitrospinaceae bacterium]NIT81298.1 hypothetical protein [Nitrospinaceae bacterium]NIU43585.1 hypothetical protein [Nitrospinaceae bacterium]
MSDQETDIKKEQEEREGQEKKPAEGSQADKGSAEVDSISDLSELEKIKQELQ